MAGFVSQSALSHKLHTESTMDTVNHAMENIPDQLREQFERECLSAHGQGTGTKKNRASKGEKKRAKRNRRKFGYGHA